MRVPPNSPQKFGIPPYIKFFLNVSYLYCHFYYKKLLILLAKNLSNRCHHFDIILGRIYDKLQMKNFFAYHLRPLYVPPVVRVPQVGNPCHRCTRLKIQGRGQLRFLTKFHGGQCFPDKIARGSPIWGFIIAFFLTSFLKISLFYAPSLLSPCVLLWSKFSNL